MSLDTKTRRRAQNSCRLQTQTLIQDLLLGPDQQNSPQTAVLKSWFYSQPGATGVDPGSVSVFF